MIASRPRSVSEKVLPPAHRQVPYNLLRLHPSLAEICQKRPVKFHQTEVRSLHLKTGDADLYGSDRKSTRLNSSHVAISYAVFCLKKKKCKQTKSRNGT